MSLFSSIDRRINADGWFVGLSHDAQLVWLRILTGNHVTPVAGLWAARETGLAEDFGFPLKRFRELFAELSREPASNGLPRAVADWKAGVIWLPNAIKQECNQPNNWKTLQGWFKYLDLVTECEVRASALRQFATFVDGDRPRFNISKGSPNPYLDRLVNSWSNGIGYRLTRAPKDQERERDKKREQEQEPPPPTPIRFAMHAGWRPAEGTLLSFDAALIPRWASEQMAHRHRSHFCPNHQDLRTDAEWNQSLSKWVFRDWANPARRPAKPDPADPQHTNPPIENPAQRALREAGL